MRIARESSCHTASINLEVEEGSSRKFDVFEVFEGTIVKGQIVVDTKAGDFQFAQVATTTNVWEDLAQ